MRARAGGRFPIPSLGGRPSAGARNAAECAWRLRPAAAICEPLVRQGGEGVHALPDFGRSRAGVV